MSNLTVTERDSVLVVDSRLIAQDLGITHKSLFETLDNYLHRIEAAFGVVRFEILRTPKGSRGGRPKRYALLTENQLRAVLSRTRSGLSLEAIEKFAEYGWDFSAFVAPTLTRNKKRDVDYCNALAHQIGGKREVLTLAGNIDVLTSTELIEIKPVIFWKAALGQVLVYGDYYPSHQKRIHLFGETQEKFLKMVRWHCKKRNVVVTWEP